MVESNHLLEQLLLIKGLSLLCWLHLIVQMVLFLARDAIQAHGWDGTDPRTAKNGTRIYRNGDFRSHAIASDQLDKVLSSFFALSDFKKPRTIEEYRKYVKFKMEVFAFIYEKWAKKKIIGKPIDVIVKSRCTR